MTRRAAIYCRISQDREGAGLGVDRQVEDCRALATRLGWTVAVEHIDNDLSAYSGKLRPGYRALLQDLDTGRADAVLVWHTDRLHRSPRELEEFVDLCERRSLTVQTVQAGELDLATPSGRAVARTLGAWARFEVEHKSERTRRAQLQAAQEGRWLGGARPFGWRPDGAAGAVLDPAEAKVVRDAARDFLAGRSLTSIANDLNARGTLTARGTAWNTTTLRRVLTRARNAGLTQYRGEIVGASTWPAILAEDTWQALTTRFAAPERIRTSPTTARWLLSGLATCGKDGCDQPVRSATVASNRAKGTTRAVYRCTRTGDGGHAARSAQQVDDLVTAVILERLRRDDLRSLTSPAQAGPDAEGVRVELVQLRIRMGETADLFADGQMTKAQFERINARLTAKVQDLEAVMARSARGSALTDFTATRDPEQVWDSLDLERRRAIVRELVRVRLLPTGRRGNAFDPESVSITWR